MYIQIAEDYEALQKFTLVSEILELGKKNNAQPMKYLDEFLVLVIFLMCKWFESLTQFSIANIHFF